MKKLTILLCVMLSAAMLQAKSDEDQIRQVIQEAYVDAIHNQISIESIDKGFHPGFEMILLGRDQITISKLPIYTWRENIHQAKAAGRKPEAKTECKILFIDITGVSAVAKFELHREGTLLFTDYMSFYKFEDGWKIVSKIFHRHQ